MKSSGQWQRGTPALLILFSSVDLVVVFFLGGGGGGGGVGGGGAVQDFFFVGIGGVGVREEYTNIFV